MDNKLYTTSLAVRPATTAERDIGSDLNLLISPFAHLLPTLMR